MVKKIRTKLKKTVYHHSINDKWTKINIGGKGISGKKKKGKIAYERSKGKKTHFKRIDGEEIVRVRNKNQAEREKVKFKTKKINKVKEEIKMV